jgi:hypothetical protein
VKGLRKKGKLLIIEGIPKSEKLNESLVLSNFLRMTQPERVKARRVTSKTEFLNYLRRKTDLAKFRYVHISAHGDPDNSRFELPSGFVSPEEFPVSCFKGKVVTISACSTSRVDFVDPFMDRTGAKHVIAPIYDVAFIDAAVWYINFYYLVLHHGFTPRNAFDRTDEILRGKAKGGFQYWT